MAVCTTVLERRLQFVDSCTFGAFGGGEGPGVITITPERRNFPWSRHGGVDDSKQTILVCNGAVFDRKRVGLSRNCGNGSRYGRGRTKGV